MRHTLLQPFFFFFKFDVYLHVTDESIISKLITHVCVSLWLGGDTRELIGFTGSRCNGFIPQDLITVRCPMCAGFKHPPAWLSACQLGLWGPLPRPSPHGPKMYGSPHLCCILSSWKKCSTYLFFLGIYYFWWFGSFDWGEGRQGRYRGAIFDKNLSVYTVFIYMTTLHYYQKTKEFCFFN